MLWRPAAKTQQLRFPPQKQCFAVGNVGVLSQLTKGSIRAIRRFVEAEMSAQGHNRTIRKTAANVCLSTKSGNRRKL
jgi:hypothetical protein